MVKKRTLAKKRKTRGKTYKKQKQKGGTFSEMCTNIFCRKKKLNLLKIEDSKNVLETNRDVCRTYTSGRIYLKINENPSEKLNFLSGDSECVDKLVTQINEKAFDVSEMKGRLLPMFTINPGMEVLMQENPKNPFEHIIENNMFILKIDTYEKSLKVIMVGFFLNSKPKTTKNKILIISSEKLTSKTSGNSDTKYKYGIFNYDKDDIKNDEDLINFALLQCENQPNFSFD